MRARQVFAAMAAAAGVLVLSASASNAAPASGAGLSNIVETNPLVQDVRVFCYNRRTGRFLHWGHCRRTPSRPRVYCYNRRTGKFLHWGSCRRY